MLIFAVIGLTVWLFIWSVCLLGHHIARTRYKRNHLGLANTPKTGIQERDLPGVSILRPLRGLDPNLFENLESSFTQEYPRAKFEILFSVAKEDDQAIPIVRHLMEKHPDVNAQLIVGQDVVGINPKINNMARSYAQAKNDLLWVIDSNAITSNSVLYNMVCEFLHPTYTSKPIGMVHHTPFPIYPDTYWGSRLEQAFLGTTHAKMYLALNATQIDSCIMGKSTMWRKSDIERTVDGQNGGLRGFSNWLGEDNMIGRAVWHDLGLRHAMNADVVGNVVGSMTLKDYVWRRVRWLRVRKYMVMASTLAEPFTESLLIGVIGGLAFKSLTGFPFFLFYLLHLAAWFWVDASVYASMASAAPLVRPSPTIYENPFSLVFFQSWFLRELLALPIWLFAMSGNNVSWRNNEPYCVKSDGHVVYA